MVGALGKHVRKLPQELRRSLTWDRGKEMADRQEFHRRHQRAGLFLRSMQSLAARQQRDTNGLLRQYFPRGTMLHASLKRT